MGNNGDGSRCCKIHLYIYPKTARGTARTAPVVRIGDILVNFVHLHTHTGYSLLDGACKISKLITHAKNLGQTALAITDHGVMYGAIDFYKEAKKQGIKPIIGCEVYVAPRTLYDKTYEYDHERYHLVLLAKNNIGYKNLMKLVSIGHIDGFYVKPRIDKSVLRKHSEGLICLSACVAGDIPAAILSDDLPRARKLIEEYIDIFGKENFFLELQNHGLLNQAKVNSHLVTFANEYGIDVVATNDVHYIEQRDAEFQDILLCIQTGKSVTDTDRLKFESDQLYLKSGDEMASLFSTLPKAISNTVKIAEMCNVEIEFGKYHLPSFKMQNDMPPFEYLKKLCFDGLSKRYVVTDELKSRLEFELETIKNMGFVDYFLIVWDFIKYAKDNGIMVGPGRGSAAGSLASYCLNITEVDPIKYNLLFERFLNPDRITMPDIDIDFCVERRGEVINYVTEKYGKDKVAQIITFGTLSARTVVRDVGRALDVPYGDVDTIAKLIPFKIGQTIDEALNEQPLLKMRYENDPTAKHLIDCARELEGLPRHASTHAAGVVITKNTLSDYVPLQLSDEGGVVAQFSMTTLEELGLLKMDFLGLRNLTIIRNALSLIGKGLTVNDLLKDRPEVYKLIASGDTDGVFQLESNGMKAFMRDLKPAKMEDLIAGISLYRPGPADSIPKYISNKNNPSKIQYPHPDLEPILSPTYGCIIYQEQVMQIVQVMAGFTLGRADLLRRAMSKKKSDMILKEGNRFIYGDEETDGAIKRGMSKETGEKLFNEMANFAKYAFNKSHAAAYAMVAYETAYLKAFYPIEFMCALMTSHMYDTPKLTHYINSLPSMGIKLIPPDIERSFAEFVPENGKIIFGLTAIKNVGKGLVDEIVKERENGKFASLSDFCARMCQGGLNKKALESLIRSGAFDSLGGCRSQYLSVFETTLEKAQNNARYNFSGQMSLLGDLEAPQDELPDIKEFANEDLLTMEKEVIGIFVSGHPLDKYRGILSKSNTTDIADILSSFEDSEAKDGQFVKITGIITSIKQKFTKKDEQMAFATAEDLTGVIEIIIFPKAYKKYESILKQEKVLQITGKIDSKEGENPKIILDSAFEATDKVTEDKIYIKIPPEGEDKISALKEILRIYSGKTPVFLYYEKSKKTYAAGKELYVTYCDAFKNKIITLLGVESDVKLVNGG